MKSLCGSECRGQDCSGPVRVVEHGGLAAAVQGQEVDTALMAVLGSVAIRAWRCAHKCLENSTTIPVAGCASFSVESRICSTIVFLGGPRIVHFVTEICGSRLSRAFVLGAMALEKALSLSSKCMRSVVTVHRLTRGIMWVRPDALDG